MNFDRGYYSGASPAIEAVVVPRVHDLGGGFEVRRSLPSTRRRFLGPFVFFDHFGPVEVISGRTHDVRPHPHIGLATVSYLFEGMMTHRDSLGSVQRIRPGDVNWMTAGRGIVHSERMSDAGNPPRAMLSGVQTWIALPQAKEDMNPDFGHYDAESLPEVDGEGLQVKLILGSLFGARSPVATLGGPVYADCRLEPGARLAIPAADVEECGAYVISGRLQAGGQDIPAGTLVVFKSGTDAVITADVATRFMLVGGARLDGPRHLWWNFVSSSKERIEMAKADWRAGRFPRVPGEEEFIPLPE